MAVMVVVMVGKVTEWVPGLTGVPLAKIAFLFVVLYAYRERHTLVPVRMLSLRIAKPAIAFLVLAILSVSFSIYRSNTLIASQAMIVYLIAFIVLVKITQSPREVELMLLALAASAVSLAAGVIFNYRGGRAHINGNFDPNDIAYNLDTLLPVVIALGMAHSKRMKWSAWGIALIMVLAILLTGSLGGTIGLGVVIISIVVYPISLSKTGELRGFTLRSTILKLALIALLGIVIWGNLPPATQARLSGLQDLQNNYNAGDSNASRLVLWRRHIELALQRPIGYGMGSAPAADGRAGGQYRTSHNSSVQAFIELGALGLVLFWSTYYITWTQLGRVTRGAHPRLSGQESSKARLYARALRIALVGNIAAGFFLSEAYSPCIWMLVAVCASFVRIATAGSGARQAGSPSEKTRSNRVAA
jgi:O-antigen ligase